MKTHRQTRRQTNKKVAGNKQSFTQLTQKLMLYMSNHFTTYPINFKTLQKYVDARTTVHESQLTDKNTSKTQQNPDINKASPQ